MNKVTILVLLAISFFFTSCLDVVEEIYLNKDGSGKYTVTIDMSGLFADDFMKSMIQSSLAEQEGMNLSDGFPEMDTVIYFKDLPADQKGSDPAFWNKVTSNIVMSDKQGKFITSINLNFDKASDITYLYQNLDRMGEGNAQLGGLAGEGGVLPSGVVYTLAKNVIGRKSAKVEAAEGEEMEMMKMFLGSATHRVVYNLPGNAKKVTIPGAVVKGKTVTVEAPLVDVMEGNAKLDGTIKFK
jgi:hypothetical protein